MVAPGVQIIRADRETCRSRMAELLALEHSVDWEHWTESAFLSDRDLKWEASRLALIEGKIIGFAFSSDSGQALHLHRLVVAPAARRSGIASLLLRDLETFARSRRFRALTLKVAKGNQPARGYYERHGFVVTEAGDYIKMEKRLGKTVAIHQPNFLPWAGYFTKLRHADVFIILDDAQMPGGGSYVYRTQIRHPTTLAASWLSIPTASPFGTPIFDVRIAPNQPWRKKHLGTLQAVYRKTPFFKEVFGLLETMYEDEEALLARFNIRLIQRITEYLDIKPEFQLSSELKPEGVSDDRLITLVKKVGGATYLSGKGGDNYQDEKKFSAAGIKLDVKSYSPVPYEQVHGAFLPGLSIIDALFHLGPNAREILVYKSGV